MQMDLFLISFHFFQKKKNCVTQQQMFKFKLLQIILKILLKKNSFVHRIDKYFLLN